MGQASPWALEYWAAADSIRGFRETQKNILREKEYLKNGFGFQA